MGAKPETEQFKEDAYWSLGTTEVIPDGPIRPYLQFNCPNCDTPNAFEYGLNKRDMPINCVQCEKKIRLRVAMEIDE